MFAKGSPRAMPRKPHTPLLLPDMPGHALLLCPAHGVHWEVRQRSRQWLAAAAKPWAAAIITSKCWFTVTLARLGQEVLFWWGRIGVVTPVLWPGQFFHWVIITH